MSLTTIIFLAFYVIGFIATLYNPLYGIVTYIFEWHNHPPYWWWGKDLPDIRWAFSIAMITMLSVFLNRKKLPPLEKINYQPMVWIVLFVMNAYLVSYIAAILPKESLRKAEDLLKIAIHMALFVYIIRRPKNYHLIVWVILLSVGNFGRISFQEGSNRDLGVYAPHATGGNAIAAYVMAVLPFYGIMFLTGKRWEKILSALIVPFIFNMLILENSRAAIVGLLVVVMFSLVWLKGKTRFRMVVAILFAGVIFLQLTNEQFWERQKGIDDYEEDTSSMSRFYLWKGVIHMIGDYPFGVGGEGYEEMVPYYVPELRERIEHTGEKKSAHNTFFNVLSEWGILGLVFYVGFLIQCFVILRSIKRDARLYEDQQFYHFQALALQLSFIAIISAGMFHNQQYLELFFWNAALSISLRNMQLSEISLRLKGDTEALKSYVKPH